jgi:integrase
MASIVREPNGRKRIQYMLNGEKKTIRLGRVELRHAETVKTKVEALLSARITGVMDAETSRWVASIPDELHQKLAHHGLVPRRDQTRPTLSVLLNEFFAHADVKPSTRLTYEQTRRSLEDYFKGDPPLERITPLEADRWRAWLKDEGLAEATVSKRVKTARQIFRQGVKWKMVAENPFEGVRAGSQTNRERMYFVSREVTEKVLEACPNWEWRLIVALSRYGGLRCPSEHLSLRWADIDWERGRMVVRSPKTEKLEGREYRVVPLFPELRPHLLQAFEHARTGAEYVLTRCGGPGVNLRTQLLRILARAGVAPWPRLFQNLRSSRQTELAEQYPIHVVCAWLGNTPTVALGHYLQVHDKHYEMAAGACRDGVSIPAHHDAVA